MNGEENEMRKRFVKIVMMLVLSMAMLFAVTGNNVVEAAPGTDVVLGQVCLMAFSYAPYGWMECNGDTISINDNTSLYSLLGTRFGGNGSTTFALPKLDSPVEGARYCIATTGIFPSQSGQSFTAYLGQIELFPYTFVPGGWARCEGQPLQVAQNNALYAIIGNAFGGDTTTMYLPDLRGTEPNENMHYYICLVGDFPFDGAYSDSGEYGMMGSINLYKRNTTFAGSGECDGGLLSIPQYTPLYALTGVEYGGDGSNTFGKPDLRGFTPHQALSYYIQTSGTFPQRP